MSALILSPLLLFSTQNLLGGSNISNVEDVGSDALLTGIYNNSIKSVVGVDVNIEYPDGYYDAGGQGSGFIYDDKGYVLTNYHVIAGDPAGTSIVSIKFINGNSYPVTIVGADKYSDLAILKIDDPSILAEEHASALPLSNSPLTIGQHVVAIGNPIGLTGTMTQGIVSQLNRNVPIEDRFQPGMVQFDAIISHGNSGGPLLNMKGEVIGVNSIGMVPAEGGVTFSFAIPLSTVKRVVPPLISDGTYVHPWLGVGGVDIDPVLAHDFGLDEAKGVIVTEVTPGSPAESAGISSGTNVLYEYQGYPISSDADIILGLDNMTIRGIDDIINFIDTKKVGDTVAIRGIRNGIEGSIVATLTARPQ